MSAETIILLLGAILILSCAVGGGFEAKEVKIPKLGTGSRIVAGVFGVLLLALGVILSEDTSETPPENTSTALEQSSEPSAEVAQENTDEPQEEATQATTTSEDAEVSEDDVKTNSEQQVKN